MNSNQEAIVWFTLNFTIQKLFSNRNWQQLIQQHCIVVKLAIMSKPGYIDLDRREGNFNMKNEMYVICDHHCVHVECDDPKKKNGSVIVQRSKSGVYDLPNNVTVDYDLHSAKSGDSPDNSKKSIIKSNRNLIILGLFILFIIFCAFVAIAHYSVLAHSNGTFDNLIASKCFWLV